MSQNDIEIVLKVRKTKSDIMSVSEAIKSNKSSKNHKLNPKPSKKADRTKSKESKQKTLLKKHSHQNVSDAFF
jgi:hypothetical protein